MDVSTGDAVTRLISLLLLLLSIGAAGARELRVVGGHFDDMYERRANGEFHGLGVDVMRAMLKRSGDTARFEIYPWARAQAMVAAGQADILVGPYKTPERALRMAFSAKSFMRDDIVFYARSGADIAWKGDYAALAGKSMVVVKNWAYGGGFDEARAKLQIHQVDTVPGALKMLTQGHVDLFPSNRRNVERLLAHLHLSGQVVALPHVMLQQEAYFAYPRKAGADAVRLRMDAALRALAESGELKRLGQRYPHSRAAADAAPAAER
jgi:polar amino acid transport system substrate-binding protein